MMRKTLLQSLAVMAIGAAIGYLAANGGFTASSGVQAATSDQPAIGGNKSAAIGSQRSEGCEINPAILLAQAETKKSARRRASQPVKKPNIVFIMGDDIGMWNIGAYH